VTQVTPDAGGRAARRECWRLNSRAVGRVIEPPADPRESLGARGTAPAQPQIFRRLDGMSGCYDYNDYCGDKYDYNDCYRPRKPRRRHHRRYEGCWDYNSYCN
jgi:hypothetical protein